MGRANGCLPDDRLIYLVLLLAAPVVWCLAALPVALRGGFFHGLDAPFASSGPPVHRILLRFPTATP
jgi:hypothetical protein